MTQEEISIQKYNELLIKKKLEEINASYKKRNTLNRSKMDTRRVYNKKVGKIKPKLLKSHL